MMAGKECTNCYRRNKGGASYCSNCGTALPTEAIANKRRSPLCTIFAVSLGIGIGSVVDWNKLDKLPEQYDSISARVSSLLSSKAVSQPVAVPAVAAFHYEPITDKEELYTYMKEKEAAINRETPIMVNQLLKLNRTHYRPSTRTMTYHFEVIRKDFDIQNVPNVITGLKQRYCTEEQYADLRANRAPARFIYWQRGVRALEVTARRCNAQHAGL